MIQRKCNHPRPSLTKVEDWRVGYTGETIAIQLDKGPPFLLKPTTARALGAALLQEVEERERKVGPVADRASQRQRPAEIHKGHSESLV